MRSLWETVTSPNQEVLRPPALLVAEKVLTTKELEEYTAVATAVGYAPPALLQEQLKKYLLDNEIHVYNPDSVHDYLNNQFKGKNWGWRPLRKIDEERRVMNRFHWTWQENGGILPSTYTKAVPLPVLLRVKELSTAIPEVSFFISDEFTRIEADPFLLVTAQDVNNFIIERWNEPSFRE